MLIFLQKVFVGDQTGKLQILSAKTVNSVSLTTIQAVNETCTQDGCGTGINSILNLKQNDLTQELILTKSYARSYNFLFENLDKNRRFLTRSKKILHGNLSQIL